MKLVLRMNVLKDICVTHLMLSRAVHTNRKKNIINITVLGSYHDVRKFPSLQE
jgi:hypothetical protein